MTAAAATVRAATFDVLRAHRLTTIFANPGSTEVPLLAGLPDDLRLVLALHEGSAVGMASGWAIGSGAPALVLVHTTAGLGNAVGALATARSNRAPLVVIVGQQDRRHLAHEPFLAGHRLGAIAGDCPVWVGEPGRPDDVPGAIGRAVHEAETRRGPAVVVVPMDDWHAPTTDTGEQASAARVVRAPSVCAAEVDELAAVVDGARRPAIVVGAGADDAATWSALVALAERLACPVFQEPFGARAGFPQDHPCFAGHLPADRGQLRRALEPHDAVVVVGGPAFRQYPFADGPLVPAGTRVALVTDDPDEAHRSPVELALLATPSVVCAALAERVAPRESGVRRRRVAPGPPALQQAGDPLESDHVLAALGARLEPDTILVEEAPSARPQLHERLVARAPLGFVSAAMGGLGFALPAAAGLRLARPDRPVAAVVGDGSAMYQPQALWSAARYRCGVLYVVLVNGRYAIMDRLAAAAGGDPPWPGFAEIDVAALAAALGCRAQRACTPAELEAALDAVIPTLRERDDPLVLAVEVR